MNILQWYLHNSPFQAGKGHIYNLFQSIAEQNNPLICSYDDNINVEVDLHDKIQRHIFFYGCYRTEIKYKNFMRSLIQPGDTVLDIGTHIGYYTLMFANWVGNTGRVFAFEASEKTYNKLTANIKRNNFHNITAINAAASNKEEERSFYLFNGINTGSNSLYQINEDMRKETIKAVDTQKVLSDNGCANPRLIKIDVEGHEPVVLRNIESLLDMPAEKSPHVFVEVNKLTFETAGHSPEDVFDYMWNLGYQSFQITKQGKPVKRNNIFFDGLVYFAKI